MPLAAFVNDERKLATDFSSDEWDALKRTGPSIELDCRHKGFMRVSSLGTQHFVHYRPEESCTSGPETPEHDRLKTVVAQTAQQLGWEAKIEGPGPDGKWRADVLAIRNTIKVALEIQLSPISAEDLQRRHEAYRASGVRARWFCGKNAWSALYALPEGFHAFHLMSTCAGDTDVLKDLVSELNYLVLPDAVSALLRGQFRFCRRQRFTAVEGITILRLEQCFSCKRPFNIYTLSGDQCYCDREPNLLDPDHECETGESMTFISPGHNWSKTGAPWIKEAVQEFVAENPSLKLNVAYPGWHKVGNPEVSMYTFQCVHCRAVLNRRDVENLVRFGKPPLLTPIAAIPVSTRLSLLTKSHWCYSKKRKFCELPKDERGRRLNERGHP